MILVQEILILQAILIKNIIWILHDYPLRYMNISNSPLLKTISSINFERERFVLIPVDHIIMGYLKVMYISNELCLQSSKIFWTLNFLQANSNFYKWLIQDPPLHSQHLWKRSAQSLDFREQCDFLSALKELVIWQKNFVTPAKVLIHFYRRVEVK